VWNVMFVDIVIFTIESMLVYAYRNQAQSITSQEDPSVTSLLLLMGLRNQDYV